MEIDLTGVGTVISTLTGLLVAGGSVLLQRQRRSVVDADEVEDQLEIREEQYRAAMRHIRLLEDDRVANTNLPSIRRPPELKAGYLQSRQARGRGRRSKNAQEEEADAEPTR